MISNSGKRWDLIQNRWVVRDDSGPTAEDILRTRLHDATMTVYALRIELARLEALIQAINQPAAQIEATAPVLPVHRAMRFGAGNHMRIGLIT